MNGRKKGYIFWLGWLFLLGPSLAANYFLMPMPGSQSLEDITVVWRLKQWEYVFMAVGFSLMVLPFIRILKQGGWVKRICFSLALLLNFTVLYFIHFVGNADAMFDPPQELTFNLPQESATTPGEMVIGVNYDGIQKAYPVRYLAYHHWVEDEFAGKNTLVTYCSMCRSGRVFIPEVDGKPLQFILVGANHYNAMFEDVATGSWWHQANGMGITGEMKGKTMPEIPCEQMSLGDWVRKYPSTLVMNPDPASEQGYKRYGGFIDPGYTKRLEDAMGIWDDWSLVLGVEVNGVYKAYPWEEISKEPGTANDFVGGEEILITITEDGEGAMVVTSSGTQVKSYQEYWHSWKHFHPNTEQWKPSGGSE